MPDTIIKASQGEVWIQPDGPNNPVYSFGQCTDLGDIDAPDGATTPIRCRDQNGDYITVADEIAAPDKVTTNVTLLSPKTRTWLDKLGPCRLALYVIQSSCGKKGVFGNYELGTVLGDAVREGRNYSSMVAREADGASTVKANFSSRRSSFWRFGPLTPDREPTASAAVLNQVSFNWDTFCNSDCGSTRKRGDIQAIATDNVGAATADVLFSTDGGFTWAAGGADPFAVSQPIKSIVNFPFGQTGTGRRWIAAMGAPAGAQGMIAYSDSAGAAWTQVNIGGAAAGHGATYGGGLFALDQTHIWLASAAGYIYKSIDGGVTWTAYETGVITAGSYTQVHFFDENYGAAVAAAGVVAITRDGGLHWTAATAITGAPGLNTVQVIDSNHIWVGTATGGLWYSNDFGTTWTQRTGWTGSGVGQVRSLSFLNPYVGFMLSNNASPVATILRTINGGYTWEAITTPTNSGMNNIAAINENFAMACGLVNSATGTIIMAAE